MDTYLNKLVPFAGVVCSMVASSAFAAGDMHSMHSQQKPAPAGQVHEDQQGHFREITPSAGPRVNDGADVYISADFIFWTARMDGLAYAGRGFGNGSTNPSSGTTQYPDFSFSPGFKVGLGLALAHDGYDLGIEYTWLHTNGNTSTTAGTTTQTDNLYPLWDIAGNYGGTTSGGFAISELAKATSRWSLHYNVIDVEMGRNYFVSQYLKLRPHVGFKGAWNDIDYRVRYTFDVDNSTQRLDEMTNNQDYWGFGLRTGLDTAWHFTKEFSLFADFALSALWSQYQSNRKDTEQQVVPTTGTKTTLLSTNNDFHTVTPVLEMDLGLRWETWFSDDDYHFLIQAGWEEQVWFNFNNLARFIGESVNGNLTTQGLTLKFRFDF